MTCSESSYDLNLDDFSFCNPSPAVDIAKWREDISGPLLSGQDLFFMSDLKDFTKGSDAISEYSMDSAYQSQSGVSRRGGEYQGSPMQDQPSQMPSFMTTSISPSLTSNSFVPFADAQDVNQIPATGNMDFGSGSQWFTNHSSAQDISTYSPTMARVMQPAPVTAGLTWSANDVSYSYPSTWNTFNLPTELEFFQPQPSPQSQPAPSRIESAARSTPYFPAERPLSHASTRVTGATSTPVQRQQPPAFTEASFEFTDDIAQATSPSGELAPLEDVMDLKTVEEEHLKVARSDPLYSKEPGPDGLYHCPNEGENGCNHKPTTLKCNYDKYVDSHLKPFRCKVARCESIPFSSTACLLRHEREAHGMHGHGACPNLCHYADCERSLVGHGFPRRYNLFDHMRRVHGWQGDKDDGPATTDAPGSRKARRQKRKSTASSTTDKKIEKKAKISKAAQQQQQREQQRLRVSQEWSTKKQSIANLLASVNDLTDLEESQNAQLLKEFHELFALRDKYHSSTKENLGE